MPRVLVTSGFATDTLQAMRQRWEVVDIPEHREALAWLRQCAELPEAVVIGYAVQPQPGEDDLPPEPTPTSYDLPAHEMLAQTLAIDPELPVIVSTGMAESEAIVFLIKRGAFDYVTEPLQPVTSKERERHTQRLAMAVSRAVKWRQLVLENHRLRQSARTEARSLILGQSAAIQRVTQLIEKVAPTPTTVLVTGDSGTGKELVARAVHDASGRKDQPFLGINCGALEDTLLRSELFGHERGAFTGADASHPGLLRQAGHGTLFLDEIATVSAAFQVTLLRVLEERAARPIGGRQQYDVHCRILAASNYDLADMVTQGKFRKDLYYRLNVFQLKIPPLRQRRQDIPILAQHFLDRIKTDYGKPEARFTSAAMEAMESHDWPGNVRELRNVIERALILCNGTQIRHADLGLTRDDTSVSLDGQLDLRQAMEQVESRIISKALARTGNNLAAAARLLNVKRPTLHYRIRHLGLRQTTEDSN
ncbi:sigma-54 dependent transcriptional regulator [Phycisphaerales bacterium AB-hyl4]|uniref:Sigma-54 dependent transcriptional regulator n=1 Tax=Natronomicrosphaera hydrolytica TaxID=3242702 RepID=A0ABV4U8B5_9BACT